MTNIIPIKTGTIRIRQMHCAGNMNHPVWRRRLAMLTDREWTEPLPIYTYLIDHPEGLILLDCGKPPDLDSSPGGTRSFGSPSI